MLNFARNQKSSKEVHLQGKEIPKCHLPGQVIKLILEYTYQPDKKPLKKRGALHFSETGFGGKGLNFVSLMYLFMAFH